MKNIEKYSFFIVILLLAQTLPAQSAHSLQREADRQYSKSNYRNAEQGYRKASEKKANDPALLYNTGNAIYQQGNYAASEPFFEKAAQSAKEPAKRADALHNLGNAYLKQQKYREAVEAYENSLRQRPGDSETKVNLQLAKKKLQQQQQEQQQQNQQNQQQNNDQQDQQQQQQNNDQQNQQQQNQQPNEQPQQPDQQPQQQQQQDGRMTPEQAKRLLETAVAPEDRRNAKKYREQEPGKHQVRPKKDW
ncbi:MAG: tetratricopeptide repeat protein [Lewinellaceae bacterium]|nr:tetratricopeptide repeat protein [Lewinellaceae bacterium]